jgi:hypothetical protein
MHAPVLVLLFRKGEKGRERQTNVRAFHNEEKDQSSPKKKNENRHLNSY